MGILTAGIILLSNVDYIDQKLISLAILTISISSLFPVVSFNPLIAIAIGFKNNDIIKKKNIPIYIGAQFIGSFISGFGSKIL